MRRETCHGSTNSLETDLTAPNTVDLGKQRLRKVDSPIPRSDVTLNIMFLFVLDQRANRPVNNALGLSCGT